jgi:hypothetical protein
VPGKNSGFRIGNLGFEIEGGRLALRLLSFNFNSVLIIADGTKIYYERAED